MKNILFSVWQYRRFILSAMKSDLKGRYARSRMGALWFVLNPLAQAAIFAFILSEVLAAKLPGIDNKSAYAIYLMAGMAAWGLFTEIVSRSTNIFIEYASLMKKISFPRICLPIIVGGSALLTHALLLIAIFIVFFFLGHTLGAAAITLFIGIALIVLLAFGLGLLLGIFNVFNRDISQALGVILQVWFWLTPVVYPITIVPEHLRWILELNPMAPLVELYQQALLYDKWVAWPELLLPFFLALVFCGVAVYIFPRSSVDLVDAL